MAGREYHVPIPVPFKLVHMAVHIHMLQLPDTHNARAIMVGVIPQVARYSIRRAYHTPVSIRLRHRIFTRSVCPDPFRSSVHTGGETFQGIFHPTVHPCHMLMDRHSPCRSFSRKFRTTGKRRRRYYTQTVSLPATAILTAYTIYIRCYSNRFIFHRQTGLD